MDNAEISVARENVTDFEPGLVISPFWKIYYYIIKRVTITNTHSLISLNSKCLSNHKLKWCYSTTFFSRLTIIGTIGMYNFDKLLLHLDSSSISCSFKFNNHTYRKYFWIRSISVLKNNVFDSFNGSIDEFWLSKSIN